MPHTMLAVSVEVTVTLTTWNTQQNFAMINLKLLMWGRMEQ